MGGWGRGGSRAVGRGRGMKYEDEERQGGD